MCVKPLERDKTLLYFKFFNLDKEGHTASEHHWNPSRTEKPLVMWKDVLLNKWKGPDPVLIWGRGSVCVFPQDKEVWQWILEQLIRQISPPTDNQDDARNDGNSDPSC